MTKAPASIDDVLKNRKILITCGTGGVGKTSISSAIAVRAALQGKRAVVITMDPAKRLKTSLGVEHLGDEPTSLDSRLPSGTSGHLDAIVPDTQRTFESFVRELSPNEMITRRIIENPIFELFSREFSGSNEYMALERLLALKKKNQYDLIVLDTPPSRNTLAFISAPRLLSQFFEESLFSVLVTPANRIFATGAKKLLGLLEGLAGDGFMKNFLNFASDIMEVQASFTQNLSEILRLLHGPEVGFVMVATPNPDTLGEAKQFVSVIQERHFHFDGLILNRSLLHLSFKPEDIEPPLALLRDLSQKQKVVADSLKTSHIPLLAILPELSRDVHCLEDLVHVCKAFDNSL